MFNSQGGSTNYLYLYDLPKDKLTSTTLATFLKTKTNVVLNRIPQIRRDINRPFYSAIITIPENEQFQMACKEMRYFELEEGKPSRGLPYDNDLLGSNPTKIAEQNVFVRKIPEEMKPEDLDKFFSKFGPIKSLKISLNSDHTSRKYGFVCFADAEGATAALKSQSDADECHTIRYQPKDKREFRKIYNNIYAKNFPLHWEEDKVRELFTQYGRIESLKFDKNEKGSYAFICFNSEDKSLREYGPQCAQKAVEALHNAGEVLGEKLTDKKLYVKEALKKRDREAERLRDTIKYKSSKKRCNLYVKGFPENMTEQGLRDLFSQHGEIESLKLHPPGDGAKKLYAFVCFKKPDEASTAKEKLHNQPFEGRTLTINHYEIKEIREINNEAAKDRNDFQQFRAQNNQGANWSGLANHEDIQYYLKMLLESFPQIMHRQGRPMGMQGVGQQGPRDQQNRPVGGNFQGQRQGGQRMGGNKPPYGQNTRPGGHMGGQMGMGGMGNNMGGNMMAQQQMQQMGAPQQHMSQAQPPQQQQSMDQKYVADCSRILPSIVPENPTYRDNAGTAFYQYVIQIVGPNLAPKVTGMLIDLKIEDVRQMMSDFNLFQTRVNQANEVLKRQQQQMQQ
jgi:polyadenylate-binding protein